MTPVLLTLFNRRDTTLQLMSKVIGLRNRKLYIFWDGGRDLQERKLIKSIQEEVQILLSENGLTANWYTNDRNLGCRQAIISALDWVFSHENTAMLFEDDCHPVDACFSFIDYCLDKYSNDPEIFGINTINKTNHQSNSEYGFTRYFHGWGWATWRNKWADFRTTLDAGKISYSHIIDRSYTSNEKRYWKITNFRMNKNKIDTWDFDLQAYVHQSDLKLVFPLTSLTSNVGFNLSEHRDFKSEKKVISEDNFIVQEIKLNNSELFSYEDSLNSFQYKIYPYAKSVLKNIFSKC